MLGLLREIAKTWRSIAAIILAYGLIVLLFFYSPDALNQLFGYAVKGYNEGYQVAGEMSDRAAFLFGNFISPPSVFVTMMILLMRVVVISLLLWVAKLMVDAVFGRARN